MEENQEEIQNQTENINQPKTKKAKISIKKLIPIIIAILVIIVLVVSGLFFIVGRGKSNSKDLSLIFDENKLIPVKVDDLYGYISPKNGKMVINPSFKTANSFYGNYATVAYTENNSTKYGIIDKTGKVKLSTDSSYKIKALSEYGLFIVDDTLYNSKLKALSDENTKVSYEDLGYSSYIKKDSSGKNLEGGIINPKGKKVYSYKFKDNESYFSCSIADINDALNEYYAVVNVDNENYGIVNLSNGKLIYKYSNKYISASDDNIFKIYSANDSSSGLESIICIYKDKIAYEANNDTDISYYDYAKKILQIQNKSADYSNRYTYYNLNTKKTLDDKPEKQNQDALASLTGYYSFSANSKYGIMKNEKQILPCEYDDIEFLPTTTFEYLKDKKHVEYVFAKKDKEYQLINLKNKKVITSFNTSSITSYSTSTFVKGRLRDSNQYFVYNMSTKKTMTFDSSATVSVYSNYITVSKDGDTTYYNTDLKEIYKI